MALPVATIVSRASYTVVTECACWLRVVQWKATIAALGTYAQIDRARIAIIKVFYTNAMDILERPECGGRIAARVRLDSNGLMLAKRITDIDRAGIAVATYTICRARVAFIVASSTGMEGAARRGAFVPS